MFRPLLFHMLAQVIAWSLYGHNIDHFMMIVFIVRIVKVVIMRQISSMAWFNNCLIYRSTSFIVMSRQNLIVSP